MATQELTSKDTNQQMGITTDGSQFLTFQLGEELYGVDILRVQEIKGYTAVTRIPNTPAHIKGVLNLRGTIVRSSSSGRSSACRRLSTPCSP
jgi:purine-binding chemotaxis protein CheW